MLTHCSEREPHRIVEWSATTWLVVLHRQMTGFCHWHLVEDLLGLTTTECHQGHKVLLSIGKLLLCLLDTIQGLIESADSSLSNTLHRSALIEDDYVVNLRLRLLCFALYFFHRSKYYR